MATQKSGLDESLDYYMQNFECTLKHLERINDTIDLLLGDEICFPGYEEKRRVVAVRLQLGFLEEVIEDMREDADRLLQEKNREELKQARTTRGKDKDHDRNF